MSTTFASNKSPDCKMKLFIATPCVPVARSTGQVKFDESTLYFADNDLGNGASVKLRMSANERVDFDQWVTLTWVDWNEFEYESVL